MSTFEKANISTQSPHYTRWTNWTMQWRWNIDEPFCSRM